MIFTVYADKAEEVSKRLDKLAKKLPAIMFRSLTPFPTNTPKRLTSSTTSLTKPAPTRSRLLILILLAKSLSRRTAGLFSLRSSTGTREMS